ncbi:BadF/BadG/BcrA/BcrD ATPase family protein [Deinococcus sp.]|uniref:N-acetylglucosamine kinase n=1 Tax=Deinococcus sp. TaxID=47478 RepID=UPI0025F6D126|nr:BadF/BadG/BcrA/BcrD ATPase family protein [Deinococcus sp.]
MPGLLLGLDGGGSGTKWALFDGAEVVRQGRLEALTGHNLDAGAVRAVLEPLVLDERLTAVTGIVAGISGLQVGGAEVLQAVLADIFNIPASSIRVTDDMELAYAAQFGSGEGVLVYAGTGSIAYHRTPGGEVLRAGGHGFLLGDEGGAFWQGREALRIVLAAQDAGQVFSGPLADELTALTGSPSWPELRSWVYGGGRGTVANLAPAVHRAALAGDAQAQDVMRQAGQALARLASTLLRRCPPGLPLVLAGGAANPLVRGAFTAALPDVVQLAPVAPVLGAPHLGFRPRQAAP